MHQTCMHFFPCPPSTFFRTPSTTLSAKPPFASPGILIPNLNKATRSPVVDSNRQKPPLLLLVVIAPEVEWNEVDML